MQWCELSDMHTYTHIVLQSFGTSSTSFLFLLGAVMPAGHVWGPAGQFGVAKGAAAETTPAKRCRGRPRKDSGSITKAAKRRRVGHADDGALVAAPTKVEEVPWTTKPAVLMQNTGMSLTY